MAIVIECDGGCGKSTRDAKQYHEHGVTRKVYYCDECEPFIASLYAKRDQLHTQHAASFVGDLMSELAKFRNDLPKGKLPDAIQ